MTAHTVLKNRPGVALPLSLIALLSLVGFVIVFVGFGSSESLIGSSHTDVKGARYVAEAGLEWAYDQLALNPNWNALLLGPDGLPNTADDGVLATNQPMAGLTAAAGTFSVSFRNDSQAGDTQMTGVPPDPGGPLNDTNARVIITSNGTNGGSTRTIQVVLTRVNLPPIVAALALPGNDADTTFNGNSFVVNGNDTNLNNTPGSCLATWGIAVANGNVANENVVQSSLSGAQKDNVLGKKQVASGQPWGDNTIAPDPSLTSQSVTDFLNAVKPYADLKLASTQASPLSYTNIGSSCATDVNSPTCWGTTTYPKIVYIKGQPDPTSAFTALSLSGDTAGSGILVVEDGDLKISGNFRWEGIVIVTGKFVGVGYMGGGWQTVYGAVISNETATDPGYKEALISGNAKLNYSCEAINNARNSRKLYTLTSWRET